ncbi:NmrA family NAD(P)-binding protein [Corynebacterium sp. S7]
MRYIVTGTDGKLGGRVAEDVLKSVEPQNLVFTCPNLEWMNAEKKEEWENLGISVRQGNYDDVEEMTKAFEGGDRIFIVSGVLIGERRVQQHKNVVDAAIAAGVKHITYTSFLGASDPAYAHVYVTPDHTATEKYIRERAAETGVAYNFMRNNLYMENYLTTSVMLALMSDNKWYTTAGEGRATFIPKDDSARVGAALLLGKGEHNTAYNVCGIESISQRDIVDLISELSGRQIEYCPVGHEEFFEYLDSMGIPRDTDADFSNSPVPWCGNDMVTNEASIAEGLMDVKSDAVEKLTGTKPKTAREIAQNYSYIWEKNVTNWKDID